MLLLSPGKTYNQITMSQYTDHIGRKVQLVNTATSPATGETYYIYRYTDLGDDEVSELWVVPASVFLGLVEKVTHVPRFSLDPETTN